MSLTRQSERLESPKDVLRTPPPSNLALVVAQVLRHAAFIAMTPTVLAPADARPHAQPFSKPTMRQKQAEENILYQDCVVYRWATVIEDSDQDPFHFTAELEDLAVDGIYQAREKIKVHKGGVHFTFQQGDQVRIAVQFTKCNGDPYLPKEQSTLSPLSTVQLRPIPMNAKYTRFPERPIDPQVFPDESEETP